MRPLAILVVAALVAAPPAAAQAGAGLVQPGDRILLQVEGEPQLTDTFTVRPGPQLDLPPLGSVPLAGVRRDEVERTIGDWLRQYLTHPVVRAQTLLRISVLGEVARPGFYALPSDAVVGDVVMAAGGLTPEARLDRAQVTRGGDVRFDRGALRQAILSGATLDALAFRSGDALQVPRRHDTESTFRILAIVTALPLAIYATTRIF
jgi:polysaccharide export outer membrane protein